MAKKQQNQGDEQLANVQETLVQSEQWLEKNRTPLLVCVGVIVVLVLGFFAIKKFWYEPRVLEGAQAIAQCQDYLAVDSFRVALEGDELDCIGFLGVIDEYSMTPSAKLAKLYAGECYYHLGQYEDAVEYLKDVNVKGINAAPAAKQLLGDAYVELQQYDEAVSAYKDAISADNDYFTPSSLQKLGHVYEQLGKKDEAKEAYQRIKDEYADSFVAVDVEKDLARVR